MYQYSVRYNINIVNIYFTVNMNYECYEWGIKVSLFVIIHLLLLGIAC